MKTRNIIKAIVIVSFSLLLSSSIFAQDKPAKKGACCTTATAEHKCADECKTAGCDVAKGDKVSMAKHKCTDECHTIGCAAVDTKAAKVNSAKHVCTTECKTAGCDAVKAKETKAMIHKCDDDCKTNGCSMAKM